MSDIMITIPTKKIGELPTAQTVYADDLLILDQSDATRKVTVEKFLSDNGSTRVIFFSDGGTLESKKDFAYFAGDQNYYSWNGGFPKIVPVNSTPANSGGIATNAWQSFGDRSMRTDLGASDGAKLIGKLPSVVALRTVEPTVDRQRIVVSEYAPGTKRGGGAFYYDASDTTTADDAGMTLVTAGGKRWKRVVDDLRSINITHFGAYNDGVTDDMPAVVRMHTWTRTIDTTFNVGIQIPAGATLLSSYDFGTAEIPSFKLRGPEIAYGRLPAARIILAASTATDYTFRFKARRMEVANLAIVNPNGSTRGFMENTVTRGDYCRISCIQARNLKGRCFHVYDTIDTTLNQVYSSSGAASFFRTDWSNESPGAWDHPTAIKITDGNMESHTGEYAISCIRAGQSVMEDMWFDHCNQGFDISQGGWLLKNVTQENSTLPSGAQYAKVIQIKCRFAQGAGLSTSVSGYDPSQDPSGSMPSWVNSVYERGTANFDQLGFINTGSLSYGYESSQYKMQNMTGSAQWFEVGTLGFSGATGISCDIELVGTGQYDSAIADARPQSTNFGGGKAVIRVQQKDSDSKMAASWYGEQASPVSDVRIELGNRNRPRLFVQLRPYTGGVATTFHTNDKSNFEGGQHFYLSPVFAAIDISTVPTAVQVPAHWSVNNSVYGLGYNMTAGQLMLEGPTSSDHASEYIPIKVNGVDKVIPIQNTTGSVRTPRYTLAELQAMGPNPQIYGVVICTDSGAGSGADTQAQMAYSYNGAWYKVMDNKKLY